MKNVVYIHNGMATIQFRSVRIVTVPAEITTKPLQNNRNVIHTVVRRKEIIIVKKVPSSTSKNTSLRR